MTRGSRHPGTRVAARLAGALLIGLTATLNPAPSLAHGPDPLFGTKTWNSNQVVGYRWASGAVPPSWMAAAIDAGAADVAESRRSRAAAFVRSSSAASPIAYGVTSCVSYAIACVDRSGVPTSFAGMWLRPQGWTYDWGTLRWCQAQSAATDGCFDAETLTLDEFGHIEILGHHVNYADESDYTDSVVQAYSRARPAPGWNQHAFGVCDVARLQLEYALASASDPVSTCLTLDTSLTLSASPSAAYGGQAVTFSSLLRIATDATGNRALSGDPLSGRSVVLQHRPVGGTTWTTVVTMSPSVTTQGAYSASWVATSTFEWRALFLAPSGEGLQAAASATVPVSVSGCIGRCPAAAPPPAR